MRKTRKTAPGKGSRNILQLPAAEGARLLVARFSGEARAALARIEKGDDSEALHDFRVAIRRMRSTIRAYRPFLRDVALKSTRARLREIARASGANRDIEVQLEWLTKQRKLGPRQKMAAGWLREHLLRKQMTAASHSREAMNDVRPLLREIGQAIREARAGTAPPAPNAVQLSFAAAFCERFAEGLKDLEKLLDRVRTIADQEDAHESRIAGKRLRYILEPVAALEPEAKELVSTLRTFQDDVGEMHDVNLFRHDIELLLLTRQTAPEPGTLRPAAAPPEVLIGLAGLAARLQSDEQRAWRRMRAKWSPGTRRTFFTRAQSFLANVRSFATLPRGEVEIERKYLLRKLPRIVKRVRPIEIDQGWIPGEKFAERLRRSRRAARTQYFRTVKLGTGIRRIEMEERTTRAIFTAMWPLTAGKRVSKLRYVVPHSAHKWEIDDFKGRKLFLAEVELSAEDITPAIPRWLKPYIVREVTGEARYTNRSLAR